MTGAAQVHDGAVPLRIDQSNFDEFETGLLALLRHFLTSFEQPDAQAWRLAYGTAAERWGETIGLAAAHALLDVILATISERSDGLAFYDPLCIEARDLLTEDEMRFIGMLHHMRREETAAARFAVEALTHGRMDPAVIRAGLSFAKRFPDANANRSFGRPMLRVVH